MTSIFNSVNEIIPDCDQAFLRRKIVNVLVGHFGFVVDENDDEAFGTIEVDCNVAEMVSQIVIEDLFQNGYEKDVVTIEDAKNEEMPGPSRAVEDYVVPINVDDDDGKSSGTTDTDIRPVEICDEMNEDDNIINIEENLVVNEGESEGAAGGGGGNSNQIECQCCFCEADFETMVPCCEGHLFCNPCIIDYVKTKIQDGVKQGYLECMENNCSAPFARSILTSRIPAETLAQLDERIAAANILQAELPDLVRCPKCQNQYELPADEQVLACVSCKFSSCRHCRIEWTAEHAGKKCEELESNDATKARRDLEEKMTEAIIRKCPKCKTPLLKNQGCNKLSCSCGGKMCYVCREPNIDYDHFCNHPIVDGNDCGRCKKCKLWADPAEADARKVNVLEAEAKFIAEKDRLAKLIEMGKASQGDLDKLVEDRKKEEARLKAELEKPGPSGANAPPPFAHIGGLPMGFMGPMPFQIPPAAHGGHVAFGAHEALLQQEMLQIQRTIQQIAQTQRARQVQQAQQLQRAQNQLQNAQNKVQHGKPKELGKYVEKLQAAETHHQHIQQQVQNLNLRHAQELQRHQQRLQQVQDRLQRARQAPPPVILPQLQGNVQLPNFGLQFPPIQIAMPRMPPMPPMPPMPFMPPMRPLVMPPVFPGPLPRLPSRFPAAQQQPPRRVLSHETGPAPPAAHHNAPVPTVPHQSFPNPRAPQPSSTRHYANPNDALITAVKNGSLDTIREIVASHGQFVLHNGQTADGETMLHLAVQSERLTTVECLVNLGCKVWSIDRKRNTPLHCACGLGLLDIARFLHQRGGAIDVPGEFGRTPLHLACSFGHEDVVEFLLENGADVNVRDGFNGATPLHLAAYYGFDGIITRLLDRGADFNIVDNNGNTPVDAALTADKAHVVELFFNIKENSKLGASNSGNHRKKSDSDSEDQAPSSHNHKRMKKSR